MALLPVVVEMEAAGMAVDRAKLESIRDQAKADADAKTVALRDLLDDRQLNPSSPAQLQAALARAGITVPNTNEETLKASGRRQDSSRSSSLHRSAEKIAQQAQSLLDCIEQTAASTGGSIRPARPRAGSAARNRTCKTSDAANCASCFIAPEGSKLVVADYSQIELRAAAAIAGETKMIEAYQRGEDLHRGTAAAVLGKPLEQVTKEDRQLAKAVNFGLLYGQSAPGLVKYAASSYGVTLTEDDAQEIRAKFFRTYGQPAPVARREPSPGGERRERSAHRARAPPADPGGSVRVGTLHRAGQHARPGRLRGRDETGDRHARATAAARRAHRSARCMTS